MNQAEIGIESYRLARNPRFDFQQRIAIVKDCIEWVGCVPHALTLPICARRNRGPMSQNRFNAHSRQGRGVATRTSQ